MNFHIFARHGGNIKIPGAADPKIQISEPNKSNQVVEDTKFIVLFDCLFVFTEFTQSVNLLKILFQ